MNIGQRLKDLILKYGNVFKNIVSEIIRECSRKNFKAKADLVSYAVLLFYLDPRHNFTTISNTDRSTVQSFVDYCVTKITDDEATFIKALELQYTFLETNFDVKAYSERSMLSEALASKVNSLFKEIIEFEANTKEEYDKLFKKVLYDIIISNKLGNPTNRMVVTETSNALKSVMTREDLLDFSGMKKKRRTETLKAIRKIVCGIMIFNQDAGECGHDMRNIINDVSMAYKNTKSVINETLTSASSLVVECNKIIRNSFVVNIDSDKLTYNHQDESLMEKFKELLQLFVQHEYYLKTLALAMATIRKEIDEHFANFRSNLKKLHEIVQYRVAVPTDTVFPYFIELSNLWHILWNYLHLMVDLNKFNEKMRDICFVKNHKEIVEKVSRETTKSLEIKFDEQNKRLDVVSDDFEWVDYSSEIFAQPTPIHQFCAYIFTIGNGLFVPSQLKIGLLKYNNKYYAFSDIKYAKIFSSNVKAFENKFMETVRNNIHLIIFLDLYDEIKNYNFSEELSKADLDQTQKNKSIEVQTELHPIPYYKEKNYTWNIWDIRRKALQMNRLSHCITSSTQTDASYYRNSTNIQADLNLRQKNSQTKRDVSTNVKKIQK